MKVSECQNSGSFLEGRTADSGVALLKENPLQQRDISLGVIASNGSCKAGRIGQPQSAEQIESAALKIVEAHPVCPT